jgi:pimeloyl-ACP methyl ester carboxylesterase
MTLAGGWLVLLLLPAVGIGVWLASYLVDALRPAPQPPATLRWAPALPIRYVELGGQRLRYIKAGQGPNLVLLHTLRTQLDLFEKVVPDLARTFTVYALDYPGHGYSEIPKARYDADFFVAAVARFLDALDLRDVTLAGVSIGGAIALIMAGRRNRRVTRVVAINPYDYAGGRGIARSSPAGWLTVVAAAIPVIGETYMRLRTFPIIKAVLLGGVARAESMPPPLLREMYAVGNRRGHSRAFLSLLRNAATWEAATTVYGAITVPVSLLWGDEDWSRLRERGRDGALLPGARVVTVAHGGHFLPLDRPDAVICHLRTPVPA